ncbi:uncharacterized protein LOC111108567 [Crassostrea virginica]
MNTVLLLLVFLAVGECGFGHPLLRDSGSLRRRDVEEFSNVTFTEIGCSVQVWSCPKTPVTVLGYGDPSKGEDLIKKGYFKEACRYLKEFEQCAEDYDVMSDPDCADVREFASYVSYKITTMCDNPILPIVGELRACINSHYGELLEFIESHEAISEQSTDGIVFCPLYRQLVDDTVALFKTCPNTQNLWTTENEETFRTNFYPVIFHRPLPFKCDGR